MKRVWASFRDLLVQARYEAARQWSTARSTIPFEHQAQDARLDVSETDRIELVRKSRYFEDNNALAVRLGELFVEFTVGAGGIPFTPASDDEKWNQRAQSAWDEWCRVCDLTTRQGFGTIQTLVAWRWFFDGEVFIPKTFGDSGRPRIQLIESHRCGTPPDKADQEGKTIVDGIAIGANGRPVGYYFKDVATGLFATEVVYRYIPAENIIHVGEPTRVGQYHSPPFLAPVLNDLQDLDDLQILEMDSAKENASVSKTLTNAAGEISDEQRRRERLSATTQTAKTGATVSDDRIKNIRQVLGARTVALKAGEKLEVFRSDRPSVATKEYWDYLTAKICMGVGGIPVTLVFPDKRIQGTVVRGVFDAAATYFRARSLVLIDAFKGIYHWVLGWEVKYTRDRVLADKPGNFLEVSCLPPRAVNVDIGYNSAAMLEQLREGATTLADIYGPMGKDWRKQVRQGFVEVKYFQELAALPEFAGVTPAMVAERLGAQLQSTAASQPQPDPQNANA